MRIFWSHIGDWLATHVGPYWSPAGLVNMTPPAVWVFQWAYLGLIITCLVAAVAMLFAKRLRPGLRERISSFGWYNAVIGTILFFFRYQRIPLLGMDGWRFLQEIGMIVWLILIIRYARVAIPQQSLAEQVVAHKAKYLPKPKNS
jgi:hypothetical protein